MKTKTSGPAPRVRRMPRLTLALVLAAMGGGATSLAAPLRAPLADAMEKKDLVAVRSLISDSAVNAAQVDGMTALHWAARHDDVATARALLAAGANAQAKNRYGVTPLSLACINGSDGMIALLLDAGADANTTREGGETVLMTAARTGQLPAVQRLLAKGADVNAKLPNGQTALMWATADGHQAVVEALLAAGADFRTPLMSGFTPMLFAVRGGHTAVVKTLLKAGIDVNEPAEPGVRNPAKMLRRGATPLTTAIENGHFELAALLLDLGADPSDMRSGYTPLHILTWIRKPDRGEDEGDPIPEGSGSMTNEQLIRKLIAMGAEVNKQLTGGPAGNRVNRKGCTPFMLAADTADTAYMKMLVEAGADPFIRNVDDVTSLMAAAGLGTRAADEEAGTDDEAVEAVTYLLELGADLNAVSRIGDTAMHGAAFANFPKVVRLLNAKGAKIEVWNKGNHRGWTPLLIAEGHRYGNFKPSFETIAAIHEVMIAHGLTPPPPTPQVAVRGYGN